MKKNILCCIIIIAFAVGVSILYYFYPRKVSSKLVKIMQKPHKDFDNSQFLGFDYVKNGERLMFFLFEYYTPKYYPLNTTNLGYDSIFVETLANELDFEKSDYIITYQKQLKELRHSPYLTKTRDGLYHCKETPLIPTWDSVITDKVYIYRIKKNNKFRAPGP